jgi:hypothetical protein
MPFERDQTVLVRLIRYRSSKRFAFAHVQSQDGTERMVDQHLPSYLPFAPAILRSSLYLETFY